MTLFVSLAQTYNPMYTVAKQEPFVAEMWAISPGTVGRCDRVVGVVHGRPVAAWELRGAFAADETWGNGRHRTKLSLGEPVVLREEDYMVPSLRHGVAVGP